MQPPIGQDSSKIQVLVAEDEDSFREALTRNLQSSGRFDVREFGSGEDAIEALKTSRFDVVILDLTLPGISGLNVLQWINEQKLDSPVIMLTGTGSEFLATEAMKYGAYDYVAKDDYDKEQFPNLVSGVVQRSLFNRSKLAGNARVGDKSIASLGQIARSIASLTHVANTSLATLSLLLDECHQGISLEVNKETEEQLEASYQGIKRERDILVAVTKSVLDLSKLMFERYEGMERAQEPQAEPPRPADQTTTRPAKEEKSKKS
jgi:DNA-binding NarL/FixJ family response regulator